MKICKNCRQLFDPSIQFGKHDKFADGYLCSWHQGELKPIGNTGTSGDYADVYEWSCCGKSVVGAVINGRDYPPRRSPGCQTGLHVEDDNLAIDPNLANELNALQEKLRDLEAREIFNFEQDGVFISYSHKDSSFVDKLTSQLVKDKIKFWRDEKEILIGEVIDQAISNGIQGNSLFLIVLSPSSIKSSWVQRELDEASHEANDGNKILLPVLTGGLTPNEMPARMRRFKCADFNKEFDNAYALLSRSIIKHLSRIRKNG
jgi:hypothetical protein